MTFLKLMEQSCHLAADRGSLCSYRFVITKQAMGHQLCPSFASINNNLKYLLGDYNLEKSTMNVLEVHETRGSCMIGYKQS